MDKQIEEMAGCKDCYDNLGHCPSQDDKNICPCYKNAVENYKQGYRKIPKNAVVLTREELRLYNENIERDRAKLKTIRKETAEKFAERLKERFIGVREYRYRDTGTAWGEHCIGGLINNKIDEICKEFTGRSD